jgi:hypothetical protein
MLINHEHTPFDQLVYKSNPQSNREDDNSCAYKKDKMARGHYGSQSMSKSSSSDELSNAA